MKDPVACSFFFQAEDGIRDWSVTGVQTCALPILVALDRIDPTTLAELEGKEDDIFHARPLQRRAITHNAGSGRWRTSRPSFRLLPRSQIGRASCRERVEHAVVAV